MSRERPRRGAAPRSSERPAPQRPTRPLPPVLAWAAPVLALVASLLAHAAAIRAPFFADDWLFLDLVRSRSLLQALAAPDPIGNFFRPLGRAVWFWALARAGGESAFVFHAAGLLVFAATIAMLWRLADRVAGPRAAATAAAILALTHAADVPLRWASGSQDLLATALALGAMLALLSGRRALSAVLFFLAPLAKEVAALAVVPALLLARRPRERWRDTLRREWPALAGTAAWLALAAWVASHRHGASPLSLSPLAPLAALVGAVRVLFGIEWAAADPAGSGVPALTPAALIATIVAVVGVAAAALARVADSAQPAGTDAESARRRPARVRMAAVAWLLAGALPVMFVAPIWSAYFYLFATCGGALLVGSLVASLPRAADVTVVLLLGVLGRHAGGLREFATQPDAFSAQSHVNDFYLDRGMRVVARAIADFKQLAPRPEPRTTFFFTGLPGFAAIQVADGPLVRAVYRDSSLRSHYLTELDRAHMQRGPAKFVFYDPESGHFTDESADPDLFVRVALGHLLTGREDAAREALEIGRERGQASETLHYLAAFMALDAGDRAAASERFAAANCREDAAGDAVLQRANDRAAAHDTLGAINELANGLGAHVLDARLHGRLADLQLMLFSQRMNASFESYASRVLRPNDGESWRRWAFALFWQSRFTQAQAALERYFRIDPVGAARDANAVHLRRLIPRVLPGGDLLQQGLKREADR